MKEGLFEILKPVKFIPVCPQCSTEMKLVKGQKDGAWYCPNCQGEFWDKTDSISPSIDMDNLAEELKRDGLNKAPECPRCKRGMFPFQRGAWFCEQCLGQFWDKPAPDVEKIVDQMIHCTSRDLKRPPGGFKMLMSAKHKSHGGSKSGRHRRKKQPLHKNYYLPD